MREIKFRAWNEKRKVMAYDLIFQFFSDGRIFFQPNHNDIVNNIMQYAGLKDKNGKEIYEGDIAKVTYTYSGINKYTEIGVMEFDENIAQFHFVMKKSLFEDDYSGLIVEIIGNIYENPELLGEKLL